MENWQGVADAINARLEELQMTQQELAARTGVSVATLRQLQRNYAPRRRSARTLAAISEGLRWPAGHLADVRDNVARADSKPDVAEEFSRLRADIQDLQTRVAELESRSQ